jgi:hypothetical protein
MQNLTGVPSVWGDLNLAGQTMNQLSEQELLQRKKKIMAGAQSNDFQSATQFLFGNRLNAAGNPMA